MDLNLLYLYMGLCCDKRCKRRVTPIDYGNIIIPSIDEYKKQYPSKASNEVRRIKSLDGRFLAFMNNSYKNSKKASRIKLRKIRKFVY